jgi:hypothetical protein
MDSGAMLKLVKIVTTFDYDAAKWKEAAWAVANALDGRRTVEQFATIVKMRALEGICKVLANYSRDFAQKGDNGVLKSETTFRLLRCLDQATIHLPEISTMVDKVPQLLAMIEEVFILDGYRNYGRDSKLGATRYLLCSSSKAHDSPDPGSDFELRLTLAMKRFSLDDEYFLPFFNPVSNILSDPDATLTSKLSSVKIKETDNPPARSPFHFEFPPNIKSP